MAIFGDFFAFCVFSEPRAAGFRPAVHSKFALRPHHVWKYGRHPIRDGWDYARKEKRRRRKKDRNHRENI